MRILSYNIWDGGGDRLGLIADVIRATDADAVALQEATPASAETLAAELEMSLVLGAGNSIFDVHVAWLSRVPIRRAENHRRPDLAKTLLELELDGVTLFATHLTSRHEEHLFPRDGEVAAITEVLSAGDAPHLLVGDFNALRPDDPIGVPPAGVEPRGDALPDAPRLVLEPLREHGYGDCYRALHPTDPGWTYPAEAPWLRLDYAFAAPSLSARVGNCDVLVTETTRIASDHLPLLVELRQ